MWCPIAVCANICSKLSNYSETTLGLSHMPKEYELKPINKWIHQNNYLKFSYVVMTSVYNYGYTGSYQAINYVVHECMHEWLYFKAAFKLNY